MFVNKGLNKLQVLTALISRITVNRYKNEHSEAESGREESILIEIQRKRILTLTREPQ